MPNMVKDSFTKELVSRERIIVDGDSFFVTYDSCEWSLCDLDELVHYYKICTGEVIVFSLKGSKSLNARIYQVDGMEFNY